MSLSESVAIDLGFLEAGGYARLAEHMGRHPELAIYRRYGALANETLLFYHAEIAELEQRLRKVRERDRNSDDKACQLHDRAWSLLSGSAELGGPGSPQREQYDLIMKLRKLMGKYHKALYYHKESLALRSPHHKLLEDLREWMERPTMGNIHILSSDWKTWSKCDSADLFTFENSAMDRFTSLVTYTIVDIYHNLIGRYIHKKRSNAILPLSYTDHRHTVTYSHKTIAMFTQTFTVLIASSLPIAAIVLLYSVKNMTTRLGIIAASTGLFSISMNLLTMATLQEIFAATAAFAAVLVVFLGSTNNVM
ncbi:hypothetical protein HD806DRAFT_506288 [Xylariaceae sp. AK1471]|nr:hypothetical protein HD806DRAFT_506288 [Xylariaceae sp. AK1471]